MCAFHYAHVSVRCVFVCIPSRGTDVAQRERSTNVIILSMVAQMGHGLRQTSLPRARTSFESKDAPKKSRLYGFENGTETFGDRERGDSKGGRGNGEGGERRVPFLQQLSV